MAPFRLPPASCSSVTVRFVDLFCGIGGFHLAAGLAGVRVGVSTECEMASDIDPTCRKSYLANFGLDPVGDIRAIGAAEVPDHDLLFGGFPCQAFSIIGGMKGFEDTRGTLFFEIARILAEKRPRAFVLENVKMLVRHQRGATLAKIMSTSHGLGYHAQYRVLNALDFGLPQKRERIFIVGFREDLPFSWPIGGVPMKPLCEALEARVDPSYFASEKIQKARALVQKPDACPTIWHENKSGNVSKYPYSCALRAGASYNYLLVDGKRRLTDREMLRLQGFPDSYKIVCRLSDTRRQAGNSVAVPVVAAVIEQVLIALKGNAEVMDEEREIARL